MLKLTSRCGPDGRNSQAGFGPRAGLCRPLVYAKTCMRHCCAECWCAIKKLLTKCNVALIPLMVIGDLSVCIFLYVFRLVSVQLTPCLRVLRRRNVRCWTRTVTRRSMTLTWRTTCGWKWRRCSRARACGRDRTVVVGRRAMLIGPRRTTRRTSVLTYQQVIGHC